MADYVRHNCQPDPRESASGSLQYLRCYVAMLFSIQNILRPGSSKSDLKASLLSIMLTDLGNILEKLERLPIASDTVVFIPLIEDLKNILPNAAIPLDTAVKRRKEFEKYEHAVDAATSDLADDRLARCMKMCNNCHAILKQTLSRPDNLRILRTLGLDKFNIRL